MSKHSLSGLKSYALGQSLFPPTSLRKAVAKLGFVQADPIRCPARAQDLILRQRVKGYRAGDLEQRYPELGMEEDMLYAYGFATAPIGQLLQRQRIDGMTDFEADILAAVRERGETHPRDLDECFGARRVTNPWGGTSKASKRSLERLHQRGLLRIARREKGIRVYAPVPEGQARALTRAYENAGYGPETVELMEAHGTGTVAGDAAEFEGLCKAFSEADTERRQWCALGSVKSQIGHAKAGVRFVSQGEIEARFGVANISLPFQLKGKAGEKLPDGAFVSTYAGGSIAYVLEYETLAKPVRRSSLEQNSFLKTALQYESVARLQPYQRGNHASPLEFPELMYLVVAERQSRVDRMLDVLQQENRRRTHFPLYKRMVFAVMPEKPRGVRNPTWYPDLFHAAWQGPNGRTFDLATGRTKE